MKTINHDKSNDDLKELIREVLQEELTKIRAEFVQYVSDNEQKEIEETFGKPISSRQADKSFKINL